MGKLTLPEAALLAGMIRGPSYSPILHAQRALARRNLVIELMARAGKVTPALAKAAMVQPMGLHLQAPRNTLAPYFVEEIRKYLESTYGTQKWCTSAAFACTPRLTWTCSKPPIALFATACTPYDRRHGWRGKLENIPEKQDGHAGFVRGRRLALAHQQGRLRRRARDGRRPESRGDQDRPCAAR